MTDRLETGWDRETPIGDNLMHGFVEGYAAWMEALGNGAGHRVLRSDDVVAVDEGSAHPLLNHAILIRPVTPERADAVAASLAGFFGRGDGGPYSIFSPWPASGLATVSPQGYPPLMLRPPGGVAPSPPEELQIVDATTPDLLADYEQVLVDGFPLGALQPFRRGCAFHESVLAVPGTRCFVGRVDDRPVSVAMSIASHGVNHVEFVATLADARGKGYGAAVTWAATLAASDVPAMLIASDMGRPVYERMGYLPLFRWTFLMGER
jgi:GNAT superfamily N-acetyltransferase